MAFYLRKGLNFGPIRLNLSKGGIGVSGGITGARVGLSPRGAYVHGGRGGLYYRKYARKGRKRSAGRTGQAHAPGQQGYGADTVTPGGMVEVFVDTGANWPSPVRIRKPEPFPAPELPRIGRLFRTALLFGILLFFAGIVGFLGMVATAFGLFLLVALLATYIVINQKNRMVGNLLQALRAELDRDEPDLGEVKRLLDQTTDIQGVWRKWIDFHGGFHLEEAHADKPDHISEELIAHFERHTVLGSSELEELHTALFQRRFEALARDHSLTVADEAHLRQLADRLGLGENLIGEELDTLTVLSEIRRETESFPEEVAPPVRLAGGEKCYAAVPGRLLKEKVQEYRTIDRVRHKYVGFDVDMEGIVCMTDKRILMIADKSRDYRLSRIQDVVLSLEDATVRLMLKGRKNPVILTMERPALFAARLQHLLDMPG